MNSAPRSAPGSRAGIQRLTSTSTNKGATGLSGGQRAASRGRSQTQRQNRLADLGTLFRTKKCLALFVLLLSLQILHFAAFFFGPPGYREGISKFVRGFFSVEAEESDDTGVTRQDRREKPERVLPSEDLKKWISSHGGWPPSSAYSNFLDNYNMLDAVNRDRFPKLAEDRVVVVLYVHNRPHYFRAALQALKEVEGLNETLLIISHDGYYPEMDAIAKSIRFCQVKQIYAPLSPHNFNGTFPGASPDDCVGNITSVAVGEVKKNGEREGKECHGNADAYGNYRDTRVVSLKHHWWWLMNTVWDHLPETKSFAGHILFIEEDHFLFPNAYLHAKALVRAQKKRFPKSVAVNLAPSDVRFKGESGKPMFVEEKMGNIGYAFNRTLWSQIWEKSEKFCTFTDYNWDLSLWAGVFERLPFHGSLRWSRPSAKHFGSCGLHAGHNAKEKGCSVHGHEKIEFPLSDIDRVNSILEDAQYMNIGYKHYGPSFKGFGGWSDERDIELCRHFAWIYQTGSPKQDF